LSRVDVIKKKCLTSFFERVFTGFSGISSNSKDMNVLLFQISFYLIIAYVKCQDCRCIPVCDSGEQSSPKGQAKGDPGSTASVEAFQQRILSIIDGKQLEVILLHCL